MFSTTALCETPLCAIEHLHFAYLATPVTLEHTILVGKILENNIASTITVGHTIGAAYGYRVSNTIELTQDLECLGIYGVNINNIVVLTHEMSPNLVYVVGVENNVYIDQTFVVNQVYNLELCNGLFISQRLGWVIELDVENTISLSIEEIAAAYNNLVIGQDLTSNMDDISCLFPNGKNNDINPNSQINISQSLDGKMIYVCNVESNMNLLSSVAWR